MHRAMTDIRPVARLVQPLVAVSALLVAALAVIAVAGVLLSSHTVDRLTQELQPAAAANGDVLRDMLDMETGVRAWINMGQPSALEPYRLGRERIEADEAKVRTFAANDPELMRLVRSQQEASQAWRTEYARQRVARSGGTGTLPTALFERGKALFDHFRATQRATTTAFEARLRDARDTADLQLRLTILAVLVLGLLGFALLVRSRHILLREISDPLREMEGVVKRMTDQDPAARAADAGPQEVRAVSHALNALADSQERARSVEDKIQHDLRVLDSARADFVANVSHELRTPLTTLNGYLELVAEEFDGSMSPRHARMVDAARRNVTRLRLLIDDLLTLSKAESSSTDLECADVAPLVTDVVTDVRLTASRRGITIVHTREPADAPAYALVDRVLLYRAFLNVVTNAVKFSPDGAEVEVRLVTERDHHVFEVRDHGMGIPAAELEQLGTRFFRASNAVAREIAGTGLGVRIVQTIVDRHAGTFVINSVEGEGTVVEIALPSQAGDQPADGPS